MGRHNSAVIPPPVVEPNEGGPIQFPNENDVLSGRGGRINSHQGNVNFRTLVAKVKLQYLSRQTKKPDKAVIAANIVDQIRKMDPPGRFLKENEETGMWFEVGDERARRKTGQALREDAPEIKGEMMVIEENVHRSKLSQLAMMSGYPPAMPFPPLLYPPTQPMYYPQMYPPPLLPGQYPMPPSSMPQPMAPAPFPAMTPFLFPPTMYPPPPVVTPTRPAPTQETIYQSKIKQKPASKTTEASEKNKKDNSSKLADLKAQKSLSKDKKSKLDKFVIDDDTPVLKGKKIHIYSNNSSQTDITVNSSTVSDDTTEMDVDFYEYQPQKVQVPIKENEKSSSKRSRRSQWRETLKEQNAKEFFKQPTFDDLPTVIVSSSTDIDDEERGRKKYLKCSDRRSSNSLPDPTFSANLSEDRVKMPYRKSLSMTDFDVIETLASMSSLNQENFFK